MEIKLFEEYSQDKFGIIQDTFESIFDYDPTLKIEIFNVIENIIHLNESIEYGRETNSSVSGKRYHSKIFYRYKCDQKENVWDIGSDEYCYVDGHGWVLNDYTIDLLKTKISNIEEIPYYLIEISNFGNLSKKWEKIYPCIRECIEVLKSYDIVIHNCGDLFFRNGLESTGELQQWDWGVDIQPKSNDIYGQFGLVGKSRQINICLKSY